MTATALSFDDWREAVRTDQRNRIEQLHIEAESNDPHGIVGQYLSQARDAWYNDPHEAEQCWEIPCNADTVSSARRTAIR